MTELVEGEQAHQAEGEKAKKAKKVLTAEEHNAKINGKVRNLMEKIVELKRDLKPISAVRQATLAECNALSRVALKPQAHTVKLKHAQVVIDPNKNHLEP